MKRNGTVASLMAHSHQVICIYETIDQNVEHRSDAMTGDRQAPASDTSRQTLSDDGKGPAIGWQAQEEAESAAEALVLVCRSARLTPAAYRFYRAILLSFVAHSRAPDPDDVAELARQFSVPLASTLAHMAAQDLLQRDLTTGRIRAAYPFSGVPTSHRVTLFADQSGERTDQIEAQVYAMCALDALGVPLMLRRAALISSVDAHSSEAIRVLIRPLADASEPPAAIPAANWRVRWYPASVVVYARPAEHEAEHDAGNCQAGRTCRPITNFFATPTSAQAWMAQRRALEPAVALDGLVLDQQEALKRARTLFAGVLDRLVA
jgi:hypothetical protein